MKRIFLCLLLCLFLLTACGKGKSQQQPSTDPDTGGTTQHHKNDQTPVQSQPVTVGSAEEKEKTDPEGKATDAEEEKTPPAPKYDPLAAVSADAERIVGASGYGLSAAMEDVLLALQDRYYQATGTLTVLSCDDLFTGTAEADRHEAIWHSLIEIRKASLIDLHLADYRFTFYCTGVSWSGEEEVRITLLEDAVMYFAATSYIPSEQFDVAHTFTLTRTGQDSWKIKAHSSDDNPYDNFSYDRANGRDTRLNSFLSAISARQAQRSSAGGGTSKTWERDYDRSAAYNYMQTYAAYRNGNWYTYDYSGGNCQNFGSQVLYAGGIPMDAEGDAQWYWNSHYNQDYSWINVSRFMTYARSNSGYGLVCDDNANYYDGQTGDILIMGDGDMDHTTVIADTITGADGATADYLICSNTSNYRNFPASAYYYTYHWLVRIFGWNDVPPTPEVPTPPAGGEEPSPDQPDTGGDEEETPPGGNGDETVPPTGGTEGEGDSPETGGETNLPTDTSADP